MIILDEPCISTLLQETVIASRIPAMQRPGSSLIIDPRIPLQDADTFFSLAKNVANPAIYTVSEDSLSIILQYLGESHVSRTIRLLKDKFATRMAMRELYPHFRCLRLALRDISVESCSVLGYPFVLKPISGICSIGVRKIADPGHLLVVVKELEETRKKNASQSGEVVNFDRFIAEECISGDEYAVDAYFKEDGSPVVVNIIRHPFSHGDDVSDRLYYTSREIVADLLPVVKETLEKIGVACELVNIPVHIEFRRQRNGQLIPIEINPQRFTGWCACELSWHAFGINPHEAFLLQQEPLWDRILSRCDDALYCVCCGAMPANLDRARITAIDYDGFARSCGGALQLAKVDYHKYPEFCYLFSKVDSAQDLERILHLQDEDFITTRNA